MKKNLKSVMVLLMASPLAFAQNVESYSDNNIAYPSVTTDSKEFNPEDYVLESLDIPDFSEAFGSESYPEYIAAPDVEDILPTVNPAESYFLTSSSGNGLETYNDKDLQNPSRSITIAQNQYVDIEYPGKGWIYLGETDNTTFMRYFGHSLAEDTVFTMRAKSQGTALLHFYKIDPLTGNAINDYLEVIISGKTASEDHVLAPSYKDAVPEGQRKKNSQTNSSVTEKNEVDSSVPEKVAEETKDIQTIETESMAALAKDEQVAKVDEPENTTQASSPSETASAKPAETASVQNNSGASSQTTKPASSSTGTSSTSRTSSTATASTTKPASGSNSASTTKPASSSASTASATRPAPAPAASSSTPSRTETVQETYPQTPKTVETPSVNSVASQKPATTSSAQAAPKTNSSKRNDTISSAADNELLAKAQTAYDKGQYAECLDYLTEFFNNAVTRIDEGLYLQGRALEAPSSSRNIKAALDTYETLVKRYPQSKKWSAANERVIYIKRFYFNIR